MSDVSADAALKLFPFPAEKTDDKAQVYKRFPDGTVILNISVLTPQGMTAGEWAWLQAVGALIGVIGTLLAYPFLKSRLEWKAQ